MAEVDTELEYRLSAEQRELWKTSLPTLNCKQIDVARRLTKVAKGKTESWRNTVSGFMRGKESDLRSILENPRRTVVLAEALGLDVNDLRLRLRAARAHGRAFPHSYRIPGFEDLGEFPILEALHPCPSGRASANTSLRRDSSSWSLDALVEIALARPVKGGRIVVIIDELELDAEVSLRWLAAKLDQLERPATDWRDPELRAGSIVIQPRLDRMSTAERDKLLRTAREAHAVLFVSTSIDDQGADWPPDRIIYQPGRGTPHWSTTYLDHLGRLLAKHGFSVDFSELQAWLEDDPRASWVAERAQSLGLVARHVFEGRALPFTGSNLLDHSIERARARLANRGLTAEARLLELCGKRALGLCAADLCRRGAPRLGHEVVARYFVDAAVGLAGPRDWQQVAAPGMIGIVEELVEAGVFRERDGELSMVPQHLAVVALGHHLARHRDDIDLVDHAATTLRWHEAFLAAAEALGDPNPVIELLTSRSVGIGYVAMPALTRVLECEARPSDRDAFARTHLRALAWWASRPEPPRDHPRAIRYGPRKRPSALNTPTRQLGGRSALVALGQVSRRHREVLPQGWTAETLSGVELDPASVVLGHVDPDEARARAALLIGAPFQTATFEDPQPWREQRRVDDPHEPITLGLTNDDYALWWRTVAVARLGVEQDSDARLVGTKPGFSITVAMDQNERGTRLWSEALARVLASDPEADGVFVDAVAHLVGGGRRWNFEAIQRIWEGLAAGRRERLCHEIRARLGQRHELWWGLPDEQAAWVMRAFLDADGLEALWTRWKAQNRPRWRPFLAAGLPASRILNWLLELEAASEPEMIILFQEPQPTDEVFAALFRTEDPEFLVELELRAPDRWWHRASRRLREIGDPTRIDCARIRGLDSWEVDPIRRKIIAREIEPRVADERTWLKLADSETNGVLRAERLFQADLAASTGDWKHTLHALDCLREMLDAPLDHYDPRRLARREGETEEVHEDVARELVRESVSGALTLLGEGLMSEPPPPARERVLTHVFTQPRLRSCVLGGVMCPWWAVALAEFGEARVLDIILAGHHDREQATAIRLRSVALSRSSLLGLASDPTLGAAAAEILAHRIADGVLDPLRVDELEALLEDNDLDVDSDVAHTLISNYLDTQPHTLRQFVAIIERRVDANARMKWWRQLSNRIKDARTVATLLEAILESDP